MDRIAEKKKVERQITESQRVWRLIQQENEKKREEKEEEQRKIKETRLEQERICDKEFENEQKKKGLQLFTDRFGFRKWGTPDEDIQWRIDDQTEFWKTNFIREDIKNSLQERISATIKEFKPSKKWADEDSYHKELLGYLKHEFPDIKYEYQHGSSRPDLVIGNVAIEIKGPTDNNALDNLTTKCLKYSKYYDHLIIVLFDPQFSEGHFEEINEGIDHYFPHVKIIRK